MRILLLIDVLHPGGAELFVLRLAHQLKVRGCNVFVYVLNKNRIDRSLVEIYSPSVKVFSPYISVYRFIQLIDGFLYRLKIKVSLLQNIHVYLLRKFILRYKVNVIHSHLFTADRIAAKISSSTNTRVVSTMHGDYLLYQNKIDAAKVARIFDYYKDVQNVLRNINHIVTISDEQKNHIQALITRLHLTAPISKIYNGYAPGLLTIKENTGINSISKNCFVVGMVARGIKEKGWFELISAFLKASLPDSVLLLVGGGNYIEDLKKHFVEYSQIIFTGATSNPLSYISQMDVACLPSYYEAESLPTSIIEYLYLGKPVIATYKGEIPNMLAIGSEMACGFCIDSSNSDALIEGITESLTQLYNKKDLYNIFSKNAKKRSSIFDLDQCCAEYEKIYAYLN